MLEYSFHGLRICVVQIALCPAEPVVWLNSDSGHCFSDGFFSHDNDLHLVPVSQLVHSERAYAVKLDPAWPLATSFLRCFSRAFVC